MMPVRNIRLLLAFDGTAYHGWQIQKGVPTVQGILCEAITRITAQQVNLIGSGRTDAGTHARGLVANFKTTSDVAPASLVRALNSILPPDIRVLSARRAPVDFHARHAARSKVYDYQVYRGPVMPPHLAREHFHYPFPLDTAKMQRAARLFEGKHDFASFAATPRAGAAGEGPGSGTVRTVFRCQLKCKGRRMILTVEGDGFLHHMVRNMAGTLIEVGGGRMRFKEFRELFHKRDRRLAGFTAPAHGLVLMKVCYQPKFPT